ncbi:hypothetical protein [Streptomyces sp. NBC_01353]|uniref:hypothetical protein n=1 Tax=Streptomyces sp. NBC_01353 TaxID=2903835 RepID=UPI002E353939|nr:hypothetical protein [Streptomyces sp. NBC_01353]
MASSSARGGFAPGTAQVAAATVVPCDGLVQGLPFEGVEATAERAGLVEAVEQAGGEGVARADGVDDVDLRIRVAAADAVVRDEGARPAGGDRDERDAGPVAGTRFDDLPLAAVLGPGLTVVAQDPAAVGRAAAEQILARLGGDRSPRGDPHGPGRPDRARLGRAAAAPHGPLRPGRGVPPDGPLWDPRAPHDAMDV